MYQQQNQQTALASPATSAMPAKGWLVQLKHWIVGEQDPIEQQMREIARQGLGMVRLAHAMGTIMILAFSLGSAVGICSTLIDSITRAGMFTWAAIPFDIAFVVSVLLVVCFDVASVYASFMVRLLYTRHAPRSDYTYHVSIIVLACLLESGTFGYMSWKYDDPALLAVAILIIVRAVGSPVVALYLNMARQIPISPSDISYHNFLASGKGVIRDVVNIANDHTAPLPDKIELYGASYTMRPHEEKQFARLMAAAEKRQARLADAPRALPQRVVVASATLPESEPQAHYSTPIAQAMHDWDEIPDELETDDDGDPFGYHTQEIEAVDLYDGVPSQPQTSAKSVAARSGKTSGPKRLNLAASKSVRQANRELRAEGKQSRKRDMRAAGFAILDERQAAGLRLEDIQPYVFAKDIGRRAGLKVFPSPNTAMRLIGPWKVSRAHNAAKATITATDVDDDLPPMEPQELRELQEVW